MVHISTFAMSSSFFPSVKIPRVPRSDFQPHLHYFHSTHETPVLIENIFSAQECEYFSESIVRATSTTPVTVQRQQTQSLNKRKKTPLYETSFSKAINVIMSSRHGDARFCFCEGLLENSLHIQGMDEVYQKIQNAKEDLFPQGNIDWFQYFPTEFQPTDCVILAGEGATSTFHRDPFEWTGTSLCLEGTKLWRFIAPPLFCKDILDSSSGKTKLAEDDSAVGVHHVDQTMKSYRLSSVAWDKTHSDNHLKPISSGWQSDFTLYDASLLDTNNNLPSALQLAQLEEQGRVKEKMDILENIVDNFDLLTPTVPKQILGQNREGSDLLWNTTIWTVVQKPGDLLLIPAHWWHQTYAFEPSLAISSQRCGLFRDSLRVIHHIFQTRGLDIQLILNHHGIDSHLELEQRLLDNPEDLCKSMFQFIK